MPTGRVASSAVDGGADSRDYVYGGAARDQRVLDEDGLVNDVEELGGSSFVGG